MNKIMMGGWHKVNCVIVILSLLHCVAPVKAAHGAEAASPLGRDIGGPIGVANQWVFIDGPLGAEAAHDAVFGKDSELAGTLASALVRTSGVVPGGKNVRFLEGSRVASSADTIPVVTAVGKHIAKAGISFHNAQSDRVPPELVPFFKTGLVHYLPFATSNQVAGIGGIWFQEKHISEATHEKAMPKTDQFLHSAYIYSVTAADADRGLVQDSLRELANALLAEGDGPAKDATADVSKAVEQEGHCFRNSPAANKLTLVLSGDGSDDWRALFNYVETEAGEKIIYKEPASLAFHYCWVHKQDLLAPFRAGNLPALALKSYCDDKGVCGDA